MDTAKVKKILLFAIPFSMFALVGNIITFSARTATGHEANEKFLSFLEIFANKITIPLPSLHPADLLGGAITAAALFGFWKLRKANAKNFKTGKEHGSARWAKPEESYQRDSGNHKL